MSPPAQEVFPGASTTFTVTVSPKSGFSGSVSLTVGSEAGLPSGVTGGFSPSSISASGTSTLTMNTTTSAVPYALSLTITGTSGSLTHTASTTLLVNLAPPASVAAVAGNGQVALSWPASVGASGYHLKRSTVSGGPYVTVGCPTSTSATDTGLTNGTTYYYVASASFTGGPDAGGESANSSQTAATPVTSAPLTPTGLTATPGNGQVGLVWNASSGATGYHLKRSTTSGGPYNTIASPTSTGFTDTGLTNGTSYFYVVSAVNSGGESPGSSQVSALPQATAPLAPTRLSASSNRPRFIALSWTQSATPGTTQNRIYRRTSGGPYSPLATISPTTSYKDSGLSRGASFCYVITALIGSVESSPSTEARGASK